MTVINLLIGVGFACFLGGAFYLGYCAGKFVQRSKS